VVACVLREHGSGGGRVRGGRLAACVGRGGRVDKGQTGQVCARPRRAMLMPSVIRAAGSVSVRATAPKTWAARRASRGLVKSMTASKEINGQKRRVLSSKLLEEKGNWSNEEGGGGGGGRGVRRRQKQLLCQATRTRFHQRFQRFQVPYKVLKRRNMGSGWSQLGRSQWLVLLSRLHIRLS
jgi:hypothetical protein